MGVPVWTETFIDLQNEHVRACLDSFFSKKDILIFKQMNLTEKKEGKIFPVQSGKSFPINRAGKCLHDHISNI